MTHPRRRHPHPADRATLTRTEGGCPDCNGLTLLRPVPYEITPTHLDSPTRAAGDPT